MGKERLGQDLVGNAGSKSREVNRISFSSGQCTFKSRVGFRGYRVPFERMAQVKQESIKNGGHKVLCFSFRECDRGPGRVNQENGIKRCRLLFERMVKVKVESIEEWESESNVFSFSFSSRKDDRGQGEVEQENGD